MRPLNLIRKRPKLIVTDGELSSPITRSLSTRQGYSQGIDDGQPNFHELRNGPER
jgi:hypothetical protein